MSGLLLKWGAPIRKVASLRSLPYFALGAIFVAFANGAWFFAESLSIGGDALNGYASDGHFFVASHGDYTEVTEATWQFSRIHALTFIGTFLVGFASIAYLSRLIVRTSKGPPTGSGQHSGWFDLPPLDAAPPGIMLGLYGLGMVVGLAFLAEGIYYLIPKAGGFGVFATLFVAVILVVNGFEMYVAIRRSRK